MRGLGGPHARGFTTAMSDSGSKTRELDLVGEEGDFADWEEENEEARPTRCLFSSETHPSPDAALRHAAQAFGFDLRALAGHDMDFYAAMQCLNFARACAEEHASDPAAAAAAAVAGIARGAHRDEKYLSPRWRTTPYSSTERISWASAWTRTRWRMTRQPNRWRSGRGRAAAPSRRGGDGGLRAEVETLRLRVLEMSQRLGEAPGTTWTARPRTWARRCWWGPRPRPRLRPRFPATRRRRRRAGRSVEKTKRKCRFGRAARRRRKPWTRTTGSYSYFDIHRVMLDDVARTAAYRVAQEQNPSCVRGKRVLDIGCGTGILSMFAARGGAAKVVGVDGAADIAKVARANAAHNGFGDVITVVQGKVEELIRVDVGDSKSAAPEGSETLQKHSFDVLVSEWIGATRCSSSMFDTVIEAARLFAQAGRDPSERRRAPRRRVRAQRHFLPFWDDVYGFEMPCVQKSLAEDAIKAAIVAPVKSATS